MGTLNAGISINGGKENPQELKERELYLNTSEDGLNSFSLWANNGSETKKVNSGVSDSTLRFTNTSTNTDVQNSANQLQFGNFTINGYKNGSTGNKWSTVNVSDPDIDRFNTFQYVNFNKVGKMILDKSPNMIYGNNLPRPQDSADGQIFFLLAEQ